ncbi:unnamed protein product [Clonostachys solani]|uniref:Uncharacterized protein n=1 Tax=Clonostachys solani TaxID=160281 RepID=A0A9N9ZKP1_9HYPO|nr:unnamed protein product [Clonostachys solani]
MLGTNSRTRGMSQQLYHQNRTKPSPHIISSQRYVSRIEKYSSVNTPSYRRITIVTIGSMEIFLMTIQNVQPLDQTLFAAATLVNESGPIEGRSQMVFWEKCITAQWKKKGGSRWENIDEKTGQTKLEPGYLLYFYEGTIKQSE